MRTYNYKTIIELFGDLAKYHEQLQSFGHGSIQQLIYLTEQRLKVDNENNRPPHYPYMWIVPESVSRNTGASIYTFNILIMDIMNVNNWDNYTDIMSDTLDILKDIIAKLKYSVDECYGSWDLDVPIELTPFQESFDDYLVGWSALIKIQIPDPIDLCIAPYTEFSGCC